MGQSAASIHPAPQSRQVPSSKCPYRPFIVQATKIAIHSTGCLAPAGLTHKPASLNLHQLSLLPGDVRAAVTLLHDSTPRQLLTEGLMLIRVCKRHMRAAAAVKLAMLSFGSCAARMWHYHPEERKLLSKQLLGHCSRVSRSRISESRH